MNFELLDHPADIGFRAHGATLEELFANCARALVFIILDPSNISIDRRVTISADGSDHEALLVNWLNEVLYYVDAKRLALAQFEILNMSETHIESVVAGEARDNHKHRPKLVVKAVTYHQLSVRPGENGWSADVYVDV